MKLRLALGALLASAAVSAHAGLLLSENFGNVADLTSAGWAQVNGGGSGAGWFQGEATVMTGTGGALDSGYAAANWVGTGPLISDWLLTPVLNLSSSVLATFDLRLLGGGFLDTVEVWASTSDGSTNLADFTRIATFSSTTDTGWLTETVSLAGFDGSGRLAFRYFVADTSIDGNYVGIDNLNVIPEPSSFALAGLALLGLGAARRRR